METLTVIHYASGNNNVVMTLHMKEAGFAFVGRPQIYDEKNSRWMPVWHSAADFYMPNESNALFRKIDTLHKFQKHITVSLVYDYLHYYNNRRIKANLKGLSPALHRQQALSVGRVKKNRTRS